MIKAKKDKIFVNPKIEVRKSSLHGYGVFAKEFIKSGELLEECHWVRIPKLPYFPSDYSYSCISKDSPHINEKDLAFMKEYMFEWPKQTDPIEGSLPKDAKVVGAFTLGFGQIYNSRDENNDSNADWKTNLETNLFEYWAIKDIQKDEEILTDYSMTLAINKHGSLQAALENYSGWHNRTQLLINGRHHTKPIISNPTKINKYGRPIRPFRKKS